MSLFSYDVDAAASCVWEGYVHQTSLWGAKETKCGPGAAGVGARGHTREVVAAITHIPFWQRVTLCWDWRSCCSRQGSLRGSSRAARLAARTAFGLADPRPLYEASLYASVLSRLSGTGLFSPPVPCTVGLRVEHLGEIRALCVGLV